MMLRRTLIVAPPLLLLVATLLVAADWWISVPPGEQATYVGRSECKRCHEPEFALWKDSDHDKSMDLATPETVLGDFDDVPFIHVAFEDLPKLDDGDVETVLKHVTTNQWALAIRNVSPALREKILGLMPGPRAADVKAAMENFVTVRPCDSVVAQNEIADVIRGLEREGKVRIDFAVKSRFLRDGDRFFVTTDNASGAMETFPIKYVFGVRPLQQYLIEFADGRVQCLPIAWNSIRRAWFHLYPGEPIPSGDVLHWTGPLQNWNYMCAACHSTDLRKNFDLESNRYNTTWFEIDVSCETCHGPGSLHVKLADAKSLFWDRRLGYGLPNLKSDDSRVEIETCAPCHARRRVVYPGFREGGRFLDYFTPELLDNNLYYADGQILEEDYEYGSFFQSKMYRKGVRCSDCHDPHSLRVKHTAPSDPWNTMPNNRLCTDCHMGKHPAGQYDTPAHHHHPDASKPGTRCVECHMPETIYMVADPRRDHGMRVPRPDLTASLGIPNACNNCHNDKSKGETAEWAEQTLRQWYGKRKGPEHFAPAIAAGRQARPEAFDALDKISRNKDQADAVRASAILLLGNYPTSKGHAASIRGLEDPEALIRLAAVRSLQNLPDDELCRRLPPLLCDPVRAVRTEVAGLLSRVPRRQWKADDLATLDAAIGEYISGQECVADQAAAHLNLANLYNNLGRPDTAEKEYETAIRLDPKFVPARTNLGMLYSQQGRRSEAVQCFREAVSLVETQLAGASLQDPAVVADARGILAQAHYSLGLLLAEKREDLEKAAEQLRRAIELAPANPRMRYNHGLALQQLGRAHEAEKELIKCVELSPELTDALHALAILYVHERRWSKAIPCAEEVLRRDPGNAAAYQLLQQARQGSSEP